MSIVTVGQNTMFKKSILSSFQESQKKYSQHESLKSKHWDIEFSNGRVFNYENLLNFRSNSLSDGLDDKFLIEEQKSIFTDLLIDVGVEFVFDNLSEKNIGNSLDCFVIENKYIDAGRNFHIRWLYDLEQYVFTKKSIGIVCEIGGGYGSLAEKIISNQSCKYILIDLPETNLLSSYYLTEHFKDLKFLMYDQVVDDRLTVSQIEDFDVFIVPPWVGLDDSIQIDLFINTRSMMEMNFEIIEEYFDLIHKHAYEGSFFFNINRYYKDTIGYPIELFKYPYDNNWDVIYSSKAWKQPWIHNLITQRKYSGFTNNIKDELEKIRLIGLPYCNSNSYQTTWNDKYYKYKILVYKITNKIFFGIPKKVCNICQRIKSG